MSFETLIRSALASLGAKIPPLVYLAEHAGRLLEVRSDGVGDIAADDEEVGGLAGLAKKLILVGLPGVRLDLPPGDRIRFGSAAGAASNVEVRAFEQDRSADRPIARKGDTEATGTLTIGNIPSPAPPGSGLIITYTPAPSPYGIPAAPQIATLTGPVTISPDPFIIDLSGWITSGSPEISLRKLTTEAIP